MTDGEDIYGSPAFADRTLYLGTSHGRVVALDAATGTEQWTAVIRNDNSTPDTEAHHRTELTSPAVAQGRVYVGAHQAGRLYALDAATGELVWSAGLVGGNVRSSPAVADGTVYIGAYRIVGCLDSVDCLVAAVRGSTGALHAFDATTGRERWTSELRPAVTSSPAVTKDQVIIGHGEGISGFDRQHGEQLWDVTVDERVESSPAVAGGMVYINSADGIVHGIEPTT